MRGRRTGSARPALPSPSDQVSLSTRWGSDTQTPPHCHPHKGVISNRSSKVRFDTEKRSTMYYSKSIKRI